MQNGGKRNKKPPLPVILVTAALIVSADGRVLIARRPEGKPMAGLWEFPGGKVHSGESETGALIRELKEELAITAQKDALIRVMEVSHSYPDFHLIMPLYLCRRWQGTPAPLEGQEIAWVWPENLSDFPMPPADEPIILKIPLILEKY